MNNTIDELSRDLAFKYSNSEGLPGFDPITILTISKILIDAIVMIRKCYDERNPQDILNKISKPSFMQKAVLRLITMKHARGTGLKSSKLQDILLQTDLTLETLNKLLEKQ